MYSSHKQCEILKLLRKFFTRSHLRRNTHILILNIVAKQPCTETTLWQHDWIPKTLTTNNISTSLIDQLTNQVNNQRHLYHLLTVHNLLDSKDDFCSGCHLNSPSQDYAYLYDHNIQEVFITQD